MSSIIEVNHLKKYYKEVKAVDNISFTVDKGELFGFLGINGAGKTTTINMLCTLYPPTGGTASICGYSVYKEQEELRRRIGIVYQNNCLDDRLTVKENLMIRGALYEKSGTKLKKNLERVCEILSLQDIQNRTFTKLSGGQKRRCEIARALMHTPEVLFLDEPTTGLDPATRKSVWNSITNLRKELNMTVFLTTHYMEEAAKATHIAIMDAGQIKQYGTPFSLKEEYAKDRLNLHTSHKEPVLAILREEQILYKEKEGLICAYVENSLDIILLLQRLKPYLKGFEMIKGSMDDVFLNVTGKTMKQAAGGQYEGTL